MDAYASLTSVVATALVVAAIISKVSTAQVTQLRHARLRAMRRRYMNLRQDLSTASGEGELARREQQQAMQEVQALIGKVNQIRAQMATLEEESKRHNRRVARSVRSEKAAANPRKAAAA